MSSRNTCLSNSRSRKSRTFSSQMFFVALAAFALLTLVSEKSTLLPRLAGLRVSAAVAGPPPSVDVQVTGQTSTPAGITPTHVGENWDYDYNLSTSGIVDTIPVQICTNSNNDADTTNDGYPLTLSFEETGVGGNLPGVTFPTNPVFTTDGCATVNISINTGPLVSGNYVKNFQVKKVSADPSNTQVALHDNNFHIKVNVTSAPSGARCYVTDSNGNFLFDCAGTAVTDSGSANGRFAIVVNKKTIEVATNPGQFYYNIVWTNTTGADQVVRVDFLRSGVISHGAQAIHGEVFPDPFSGVSPTLFNQVNDGIPSGTDDKLDTITVPAGWTLWADYHLQWPGIGSAAPGGIGTSCATANQSFTVQGTISSTGAGPGPVNESCTAGASGYKKPQ
jgi:hypothetical protein